ncbi:hypothetical protein CBE37_01555 [bacterium TMED277]|nr:hypothetical protein [Candidatus Pelagibacter sp.]OUX44231.1 MAG: hypothetical protein CBE37_01555 [bacterium TMED277]|tara:strand:+ start:3356 stop:4747 length:1392 start_codon:yes stop_codon:yes gene_type:complete
MKILKNLSQITVSKNIPISKAVRKISFHESGVLLILKKRKIIGYLQEGDIKRALLKNNYSHETKIEKIMNKKPFTIKSNLSLKDKIKKLKINLRFRAPIVDEKNRIQGLLYFTNFTQLSDKQNYHFKTKLRKKIFIVGGAGYIGSVLSRLLLKLNYSIVIYDIFKFGISPVKDLMKNSNVKIIKGDASDTKKIVNTALGSEAVIDLSGIVGDPACDLNPTKTIVDNYINSKMLAEISKLLKIPRYIFMSSCSVYGLAKGKKKLNEKSKLNPLSLYAECKIKAEKDILKIKDKNFCPTILRLATVFGYSPRQRFDLVVNIFTLFATTGKKIHVFGGEQYRPNIHVSDVAKAIKLVLKAPIKNVNGEIFNVGDNRLNLKIKDIALIVSKLNKLSKKKVIIDKSSKDPRDYHVDFSKIKKTLKFTANTNIFKGAKELNAKIKQKKFRNINKVLFNNFSIESKNLYN